jgi:ABC-type branched-subunit amino acid transport system substrate-binding protein
MKLRSMLAFALSLSLLAVGCDKQDQADEAEAEAESTEEDAPDINADKGVDLDTKTIHVGALNDTSGPAVAIGKPFALGKQVAVGRINAEDSELLPDGWKVELHDKDHGYNPQKGVQAYREISDEVLYVATSFGTPPTLQIRPMLERDSLVAFPASLSTQLAENEFTPPLGPTYKVEAMRAFDWAVAHAKEEGTELKPAIIYQDDDYGKDGIDGWRQAAKEHGVDIVAEQSVKPGAREMTAAVKKLQDAGANYVMLTVLPSSAGPILGTAAQLKYAPVFVGNTPAWVDQFFADDGPLPHEVFANFYWATGFPFWGEDVPGMDDFLEAFEAHGDGAERDYYVLVSYIQGLVQTEILRRAIDNQDLSRAGFIEAMHSIDEWDADGLIQPIDLSEAPYVTGTNTRILKPDFEEKSWSVEADYASPQALGGGDEQAKKKE